MSFEKVFIEVQSFVCSSSSGLFAAVAGPRELVYTLTSNDNSFMSKPSRPDGNKLFTWAKDKVDMDCGFPVGCSDGRLNIVVSKLYKDGTLKDKGQASLHIPQLLSDMRPGDECIKEVAIKSGRSSYGNMQIRLKLPLSMRVSAPSGPSSAGAKEKSARFSEMGTGATPIGKAQILALCDEHDGDAFVAVNGKKLPPIQDHMQDGYVMVMKPQSSEPSSEHAPELVVPVTPQVQDSPGVRLETVASETAGVLGGDARNGKTVAPPVGNVAALKTETEGGMKMTVKDHEADGGGRDMNSVFNSHTAAANAVATPAASTASTAAITATAAVANAARGTTTANVTSTPVNSLPARHFGTHSAANFSQSASVPAAAGQWPAQRGLRPVQSTGASTSLQAARLQASGGLAAMRSVAKAALVQVIQPPLRSVPSAPVLQRSISSVLQRERELARSRLTSLTRNAALQLASCEA